MQQNAGLFSQHVSSIIMPIFRSTLVSTAFWCPNLENMNSEVLYILTLHLPNHIHLPLPPAPHLPKRYTRIPPLHTPTMST
jgi:hypothetical protein